MLCVEIDGLTIVYGFSNALGGRVRLPVSLPTRPLPLERPPDIRLELRGESDELRAGAKDKLEDLFFHGVTRVLRSETAFVVTDGFSVIEVATDGSSIIGSISPRSLADGYTFENTTLLIALVLALRGFNRFHVHAGIVTRGDHTILVAGGGGSGKSTTVLSMVESGWNYVSDDAVLLSDVGGCGLRLTGLGRQFHVGEATLAVFPRLAAFAGTPYRQNTNKRPLDATLAYPGRWQVASGMPSLLLFPRIADPPELSALVPIHRADALGRLTESSALMVVDGLPGLHAQLAAVERIAKCSVGFELALGRDALADRGLVPRLIDSKLH